MNSDESIGKRPGPASRLTPPAGSLSDEAGACRSGGSDRHGVVTIGHLRYSLMRFIIISTSIAGGNGMADAHRRRRQTVTVFDVAKHAGVSLGTVSNVLN